MLLVRILSRRTVLRIVSGLVLVVLGHIAAAAAAAAAASGGGGGSGGWAWMERETVIGLVFRRTTSLHSFCTRVIKV